MIRQALLDDYSWPEILAATVAVVVVGGIIAVMPMLPEDDRYKQWYPNG